MLWRLPAARDQHLEQPCRLGGERAAPSDFHPRADEDDYYDCSPPTCSRRHRRTSTGSKGSTRPGAGKPSCQLRDRRQDRSAGDRHPVPAVPATTAVAPVPALPDTRTLKKHSFSIEGSPSAMFDGRLFKYDNKVLRYFTTDDDTVTSDGTISAVAQCASASLWVGQTNGPGNPPDRHLGPQIRRLRPPASRRAR